MPKTLTIALSERRPVTISDDEWPLVAEATWHSGTIAVQANEVAYLRVREHLDGRVLVYGVRDSGPGGVRLGYRAMYGGHLLTSESPATMVAAGDGPLISRREVDSAEIIRAIRRVAGALNLTELGSECVANLPPESL